MSDWRHDQSIQSAIKQMEDDGKSVRCIQPKLLNGQKTDYNDLAKAGRFDEIRKDLSSRIDQKKTELEVDTDSKQMRQNPRMDKNITKTTNVDRELFG